MMKSFYCLAVLCAAAFFPAQAADDSRPKPPPPVTTEVYAVATDGTSLEWDVYTPSGRGPWPAVLVIHGGTFYGGDKAESGVASCAQDLADAGYLAFSINYRLAPPGAIPGQRSSGRFPEQYDDVALAVQAARDDRRSNGKVGSVGGSAGATHTAWVATNGTPGRDRIDVGVGISGAYDFADFTPDDKLVYFIEAVTNYVGVPQTDLVALREASPAWNVSRGTPPLYLVDSVGDLIPAVQLDDMVAQLQANGVRNYQAMTLPGDGHSFENWPLIKDDAIAFLGSVLGRGRR